MNTPPFLFPRAGQGAWRLPAPPAWLWDEVRNRLVLLVNHVLQQEPEAMLRLRRQAGKTIRVRWGRDAAVLGFDAALVVRASAAGLLERVADDSAADLVLTLDEPSPWAVAGKVVQGDKPAVSIEGDVQLAAEVAWLTDNVRWDVEEDLARLFGDAMAHTLVQGVRRLAQQLRALAGPLVQRAHERAVAVRARAAGARTGACDPAPASPPASASAGGSPGGPAGGATP
ncbi:hypothetical protein LCC91_01080 [Tepidimonas taiwanensis]|uniref:Ubiquinone biosynthesis protein UbiJ n=1 Tax=Tepidimonas taiwanensis TaxID=307486 RepID=A0A554XCJ3_9BURK|nr:hypothetical protein [Tepidimonas taiwanensis]MCX7693249.1 hypothetical protein [Tepidimonas taiwanensis]MDM7464241.1 hypothetical protein [Tepidimonas taiwanensis]TSE33543.1 hypothetical protein Ttaiw_00469 [Tepidimonas taiwanensis]UBQ05756.1 hypothetical protein LCC91_01080 [Tepidimonas taiwanensis]